MLKVVDWWWALPLGVGAAATPVVVWLRRRIRAEAEACSVASAQLADLRARLAVDRPGRQQSSGGGRSENGALGKLTRDAEPQP